MSVLIGLSVMMAWLLVLGVVGVEGAGPTAVVSGASWSYIPWPDCNRP